MGKGKTTEEVRVMNKARVREIRRKRTEIARTKGSIAYYRHMRKAHAKLGPAYPRGTRVKAGRVIDLGAYNKPFPRSTKPRIVHPTPQRRIRTGTSHVGRASRKHFMVFRPHPRQPQVIVWFDTKDHQRDELNKFMRQFKTGRIF